MTANNETLPTWFMETEVPGMIARSTQTHGFRYVSSVKTAETMKVYLNQLEGNGERGPFQIEVDEGRLMKESIVVCNRWALHFEVRGTFSFRVSPDKRKTFICTFTPEDANIVPGEALFDDLAESIQNRIATTAAEVLRMTVYLSR